MVLNERFNWNLISRFRSEIMGVAIVFVLICHSDSFSWGGAQAFVKQIMPVFAIGVDIFLFVSGVGLYFSMRKNSNIYYFYKKRFLRIIPEFLIVSAASCALITTLRKNDFVWSEFLIKVSGIRAAVLKNSGENGAVWYVIFIIIMYAFYPALFSLEKLSEKQRRIAYGIIMALPIATELLLAAFVPDVFKKYEIDRMLMRIPIFAFGAYMGRVVNTGGECRRVLVPILFAAFLIVRALKIFLLGDSPLGMPIVKIANQCLAIGLMLFAALFLESLKEDRLRLFRSMLSWCGKASLELYLIHSFLIHIYFALHLPKQWPLYLVVVLPLSFALSALVLAVKKIIGLKIQGRRANI